jgi:uncharacterized membrane protein (UPF0127 family)
MKNANLVSGAPRGAVLLALGVLAAGCGQGKTAQGPGLDKSVFDHFTMSVGGAPASLEIAILPGEQQRGLMQRGNLGKDEGMLFVDATPMRQSFWMKNTPEALDIGFIRPDGTIAEIYPLLPFDERTVLSHGSDLQFALEMPAGWFAAHGIRPGAKLERREIAAAVRDRGYNVAKFGLGDALPAPTP